MFRSIISGPENILNNIRTKKKLLKIVNISEIEIKNKYCVISEIYLIVKRKFMICLFLLFGELSNETKAHSAYQSQTKSLYFTTILLQNFDVFLQNRHIFQFFSIIFSPQRK